MERYRCTARPDARPGRVLGAGRTENGAERGDRSVRREEPVAGRVQGFAGNPQMDGRRSRAV